MVSLVSKSFCIYGLGVTGRSVVNYFDRRNFKNYQAWDDNKVRRNYLNFSVGEKKGRNFFLKSLDLADFIIMSPYNFIFLIFVM